VSTDDTPAQLAELGVAHLPERVQLTMADVASAAREGLLAMSVAAGMAVMQAMLDAELEAACGPKGKHDAGRVAVRHGTEIGSVTLGGRRVRVAHPRARTVDGHEVPLATYRQFAADDLLTAVVMERMLAGIATRRHAAAGEPVGEQIQAEASATSRSAVSRRFVRETKTALAELLSQDLSPLKVTVLMVDGLNIAEHCCVVALGITADGTKLPLGLWEGDTENKTVVKHLLADLADRGLDPDDGLLVVIDGAKALSRAVRDVFGEKAAIQRCTLHKRRNVAEHLPESERPTVDRKIVAALNHRDAAAGLRDLKTLAWQLERQHPGAAGSLREGLEELFTVARLGITGTLAKSLVTTNPIESMISIARTTNRNVKRWRDGQMVLRWTAAGMRNAARSFRRLKGYRQMDQLTAALHRHAHPTTARRHQTAAAGA
jgi:transposase-like protein